MRRIIVLALVLAMIGVMAPPALADTPERVDFGPDVFDDHDPCTGEIQTISISGYGIVHDHDGVIEARFHRSGYTSAGYLMTQGRDSFTVEGDSDFSGQFRDPWHNPDTGDAFVAKGTLVVVDGEIVVNEFTLACLTGPTIHP